MRSTKNWLFGLGAAISFAFAGAANATIVGSTYDFSASATGNTTISAPTGTYTDPSNPGFCVGPLLACGSGSGVSGSFNFGNSSPNVDTITFSFYGSTFGAGPGSFTIDLGNFHTTDGETIQGVSFGSGSLGGASISNSWNGTDALFTFNTSSDFNAIGGNYVTFNVSTKSVPEPAPLLLMGTGLMGLGFVKRRRNRTS